MNNTQDIIANNYKSFYSDWNNWKNPKNIKLWLIYKKSPHPTFLKSKVRAF